MRVPCGVMLTDRRTNTSVLVHGDCLLAHELMTPDRKNVEIDHPPCLPAGEAPKCDVCGAPLELRPIE